MNRKQFILVLLALALIGGAGLVLLHRNQESWTIREAKAGDKVLPNFRLNDAAAIHIKGSADLNVVRKNGLWCVRERGDYPADYQQIRDLLIRIRDLKVVQSEKIGPSQLGRVDLDEPGKGTGGRTLIEFTDAQGKVLDSLLAGKKHLRPRNESVPIGLHGLFDGRYILLPSDPGNVLLISDELPSVAPEPASWLSRDFFKVEHIKSLSLVFTNGANLWTLLRENESWPWTLADGKPGEVLDTNIASQTAEIPGFLSFVDVVPNAIPSETGLNKPMLVFIETFDDLFYTLKIGAQGTEGNYYMAVAVTSALPVERATSRDEKLDERKKLNEEFQDRTRKLRDKLAKEQALAKWVYAVDPRIITALVRDRAQLLEKKTIASEPGAAANKVPLAATQ